MNRLIIFMVFLALFFLLIFPFFEVHGSPSISRQTVADGLVFSTDFENVIKQNRTSLNMGIPNSFAFNGANVSMWVEGLDRVTPGFVSHSGNKSVGMEVINGYRNEFNIINMQNFVGKQFWITVWLYLPLDWQLHWVDSHNFNWYALCDTFMASKEAIPVPYYPYNEVYIHQPNVGSNSPDFYIDTDIRDNTGSGEVVTPLGGNATNLDHFPLPLGQWFNLTYFVDRDAYNGAVAIWLNDQCIASKTGVKTSNMINDAFFTTIAKIYHDRADTYSGYKIWVDDLEIHNNQLPMPTPSPTPTSSPSPSPTPTSSSSPVPTPTQPSVPTIMPTPISTPSKSTPFPTSQNHSPSPSPNASPLETVSPSSFPTKIPNQTSGRSLPFWVGASVAFAVVCAVSILGVASNFRKIRSFLRHNSKNS